MLEHVRLALHMASAQEQLGRPHSMAVSVQEDCAVAAGFPRTEQVLRAWAQNVAWCNSHHILSSVKASHRATHVLEVETQTPSPSATTVTGGDVCLEELLKETLLLTSPQTPWRLSFSSFAIGPPVVLSLWACFSETWKTRPLHYCAPREPLKW